MTAIGGNFKLFYRARARVARHVPPPIDHVSLFSPFFSSLGFSRVTVLDAAGASGSVMVGIGTASTQAALQRDSPGVLSRRRPFHYGAPAFCHGGA